MDKLILHKHIVILYRKITILLNLVMLSLNENIMLSLMYYNSKFYCHDYNALSYYTINSHILLKMRMLYVLIDSIRFIDVI